MVAKHNTGKHFCFRYVYLIELPGKGKGFLLPRSWIQHVGNTNVELIRRLTTAIANKF